jgi:hypothetical protein
MAKEKDELPSATSFARVRLILKTNHLRSRRKTEGNAYYLPIFLVNHNLRRKFQVKKQTTVTFFVLMMLGIFSISAAAQSTHSVWTNNNGFTFGL